MATSSTASASPLPVSERARAFPESPIRAVAQLAVDAKKRGIGVFHLNIGQPDLETPDVLLAGLKDYQENPIAYTPSNGEERLVDYFKSYYQSLGVDLTPDQIQVTVGGSEALLFTFMSVADPGDEIIVPEPFYTNYRIIAQQAGLKIVPLPTSLEDGFKLPDREVWTQAITPRTKALLLCNPSNPTGAVYPRESLEFLASLAKEHDLFLIADEVYREFLFDGLTSCSILELPGIEDRAVVVDSVSKRFSLCGVRVGCLVSRNADLMTAALRLAQGRLSAPSLGQAVAARGGLITEDYFESVRTVYQGRRDVAQAGLSAIEGVVCPKPQGAFYAFVRFPVKDIEHFCRWLLTDFTKTSKETVAMAPGPGFYATPGRGHDEVRMAYVLNEDAMTRSIEILKEALDRYPGRV